LLTKSGAEAPRGLKSTLRNRRGTIFRPRMRRQEEHDQDRRKDFESGNHVKTGSGFPGDVLKPAHDGGANPT
jgi:hypothetical protein